MSARSADPVRSSSSVPHAVCGGLQRPADPARLPPRHRLGLSRPRHPRSARCRRRLCCPARRVRWPRALFAGRALKPRAAQSMPTAARSTTHAVHKMSYPRYALYRARSTLCRARGVRWPRASFPRAANSIPRPDLRVGAERRQGYHALELFIFTAQHSCALLHCTPMSQTPMRVVIELNPRPIKITRQIVYPFKFLIFVYSVERNRSNCATLVLSRVMRQWEFTTPPTKNDNQRQSFRSKFGKHSP